MSDERRLFRRLLDALLHGGAYPTSSPEETPARWRRWLFRLGIYAPLGTDLQLQLQPRFFALLGCAAVAAFAGFIGTAFYSESPRFCRSCHIMEPYYQAWEKSKHKHVACIECHYPPGEAQTILWKKFQAVSQVVKYVTRTYSSKPFAEVENISCLRSGCHAERLLQGKLVTKRGIKFDHRPHLTEPRRGRQLRCVSCHSQVMVGSHIEVTYDSCYLCHFKGRGEGKDLEPVGGCLGCHDLPTRTFQLDNMKYNHKEFVARQGVKCLNCHLDAVGGKGEAPKDRCLICHNQPEKIARYGDIPFIHENHVTRHYIACFHCHQEIRHSLQPRMGERIGKPGSATASPAPSASPRPSALASPGSGSLDCALCHERKHTGQLAMYTGRVAPLGLPEMPSPMYEARVACIGCHYQGQGDKGDAELRGQTFKASTQACVKCHGDKFKGIWEETKAELAKSVADVGAKLLAAKGALLAATLPEPDRKRLGQQVEQAERWHHFVERSTGEHNIYLASSVLRRIDAAATEVGQATKATLPNVSKLPLLTGKYCAVLCHQKVGVKVPPATVKVDGKTMPHGDHTEMASCVTCHDLGGHKRVPLVANVKEKCKGCHK